MFLALSSIFAYLNASPTSRCIIKGVAILAAEHIIVCGIKEKTAERWKIVSYCLQTSAVKTDPHEINGTLIFPTAGKVEIESFTCSCKAGASESCKHVTATLLFCSRKPLKELQELSCTDTECVWKCRKTNVVNKYLAKPLHETQCFATNKTSERKHTTFSKEEVENMFEMAMSVLPNSFFTLHRQGRRTSIQMKNNVAEIPPHVTEIFHHSEESSFIKSLDFTIPLLSNCCHKVLEAFEKENVLESMCCEQGTLEWKQKRKNKIIGSTCYSIFTFAKQDWTKMLKNFYDSKSVITTEMRHGLEQESWAREAFLKMNSNVDIKQIGIFICQKYTWLAYSPDGILFEEGKPTKLLEIKCPYLGKTKSGTEVLPTLKYLEKDWTLKQKHSYYAQIQFGMALLNLTKCEFIVYFSKEKNYLQVTVPFNVTYAQELIETVSRKYFKSMVHYVCR